MLFFGLTLALDPDVGALRSMNAWNGLDFFIFIIFTLNTMLGMVRGATRELISIMGLSAALIFSIKFTVPLAHFFNRSPIVNDVVQSRFVMNFMEAIGAGPLTVNLLISLFNAISLLICFVGIFSICEGALARPGFMEVFSFPYATLNRKVGAALGATRGYIFTIVFLSVLTSIYQPGNNTALADNNVMQGSYFARLFDSTVAKFNEMVGEQKPERYKELYENKNLYNEQNVQQNLNSGMPQMPAPQQEQPSTTPVQTVPQQ